MPGDDEEFHTSAMVSAVRDMAAKLERFERHADDERRRLRAEVNENIAAFRKDVHEVISKIQLDAAQHRDEHSAERKERAADAIDRLNRQLVLNLWLGVLTTLVVVNLLLIGFIVARVIAARLS